MIKKLLLVISFIVPLTFSVSAASWTATLPAAGFTNVPTLLGGSLVANNFTLVSAAGSSAACTIIDAPGTNQTFAIGAYTNYSWYVTNIITTWTNYYGVTNSITNKAIVQYSNSVPAATASYPVIYSLTSPTNTTTLFNSLNQRLVYGFLITNTGVGTLTFTLNYTQ